MKHNDRPLSLMKEAVELMRKSQKRRKEYREGKISDAESSQSLKDYDERFHKVQQQISEELKRVRNRG